MLILCEWPDLETGQPVRGEVSESLLVKTEGGIDNDCEQTTWVEYRFPGSDQIVHRSVHVRLKQGIEITTAVEGF